jgi:uncharacterized membrane protein YraQ (UPF0718 family)
MDFLIRWAVEAWAVLMEAAPWLVGGFVLAGAVHVLLPARWAITHLGQPGWSSVVKASLLGVPLPLCSCSVIPVASSIRRRGASRGATASFLVSTPESGVDSIAISYALLGPFLAVVRPLAAFATAITAGSLIHWFGPRERLAAASQPAESSCGCCCGDGPPPAEKAFARLAGALRYGLVDMFADLSHWLLLGFVLAGLAGALFPPQFLERHVGTGLGAMLLMAFVGLPVYVCATSSTPFAAALIAKGLSPGAALVFLLVGPATNLATMLIVGRDLGRRSLVVYLLTIVVVAVLFGLATDALVEAAPALGTVALHEHDSAGTLTVIFAMLLAALMVNGLRLRFFQSKPSRGLTVGEAST